VVSTKNYDAYSKDIAGKTLFGQSSGADAGPAAPVQVSDDLSLVGVISGDNPLAVIENKKTKKTYHLTKGQSFDDYLVEDISEGKVLLDSQGRKISLLL
jgi:type II secretory pathway component PulC